MTQPARGDKRRKPKKIPESRHLRWKVLVLVLFVLTIIFHFQIEDIFLKKYGVCTDAIVTSEVRHVRGDKDTFYYVFTIEGNQYKADSYIRADQPDQVGTKTCVVYLKMLPEISRSLKGYFEADFKTCGCSPNAN